MLDTKNKSDVAVFVTSFYEQVREDDLIGPIFSAKLADDKWPEHLSLIHI